jgi:hypothetical protein
MVKNDSLLQEFIKNSKIRPPLKPRDALFGGRTNAATLYYQCKEHEMIKYFDFTSLYPYVQKTQKMPLGEPTIISENFDQDFSNYFGLVNCLILPPNNLLFPVLPARINNKLVFTLCYECAINKLENCTHSDNSRAIEGTWVTEEIKVALIEGYKIVIFTSNKIFFTLCLFK